MPKIPENRDASDSDPMLAHGAGVPDSAADSSAARPAVKRRKRRANAGGSSSGSAKHGAKSKSGHSSELLLDPDNCDHCAYLARMIAAREAETGAAAGGAGAGSAKVAVGCSDVCTDGASLRRAGVDEGCCSDAGHCAGSGASPRSRARTSEAARCCGSPPSSEATGFSTHAVGEATTVDGTTQHGHR